MKKLSKKQIILIISVAIAIIALVITGILFGINNGKKKEIAKSDGEIESVEKDEADEEENEEEKADETDAVEDETTENTTEQETDTQTPVVEEPKQETQQQTTTNTNQNQNQNSSNANTNTGNNGGSNTGNSGGNTATTQPSTPTPTPTPEPTPEKSPYAGMYSPKDSTSFERMNKCATILDGGMASPIVPVDRGQSHVAYWNGKIWISASNTDNSWMYVKLAGWYADTSNVGSDETRPVYAEIPSLVKQCLETIAPEGGTELYNTISALVSQYGLCSQIPTQGRITESIPGLYVTLEDGRNGLEIFFWAE